MVNINRLTEHWNEADQFLDEKYSQSKQYVDNMLNPEYVIDDEAVMTKVVPEKVSTGMVAKICGKTYKIVQLIGGCVYDNNNCKITSTNGKITIAANNTSAIVYGPLREAAESSAYVPSVLNHWYYVASFGIPMSGNCYVYNDGGGIVLSEGKHSVLAKATAVKNFYIRIAAGQTLNASGYIMILDITEMGMEGKTVDELDSIFYSYLPQGKYLYNTPVESVVSQIMENAKVYVRQSIDPTNMSIISSNTRARTEICKIPPSKTISYSVSSKSGKSVRVAIEGFTDARKRVIDVGWLNDSSYTYKYTDDTVEYVALIFSYTDDSTVIEDDIVLSWNVDNEITSLVPSEARNCPGYGLGVDDTNLNIVDFENGVYHYNVEKYTLGNDAYIQMPEAGLFFFTDFTSYGSALCNKYTFVNINVTDNTTAQSLLKDGECTYRHGSTNDRIYVKDSSIANAGDFKTKNLGMEFICTLPSSAKKTIPLTDFIRPLPVNDGGTITFVNENNLDVPNTIIYKKEVI